MAIAISIPAKLNKVLGDEASAELVTVLNQVAAAQRNGFENTLENHMQILRSALESKIESVGKDNNIYTDRRIMETEVKMERRFAELKTYIDAGFAEIKSTADKDRVETRAYSDKNSVEMKASVDKGFSEMEVKIEKRLSEIQAAFEKRFSDIHASLLRWMFTFYITALLTALGGAYVFFQLFKTP
jgi:hypothetical protein